MTQSFFDDWRTVDRKLKIVVLLDTYEKADPGLQEWLEKTFLEGLKDISPVVVVIGGRSWIDVSDYWNLHSHHFPLVGVQVHDYQDYASKRGISIPEADLQKLHRAMRGIPKLFVEYVDAHLQQSLA